MNAIVVAMLLFHAAEGAMCHSKAQCREWGHPVQNQWNVDDDCAALVNCKWGPGGKCAKCQQGTLQVGDTIDAQVEGIPLNQYECLMENGEEECDDGGLDPGAIIGIAMVPFAICTMIIVLYKLFMSKSSRVKISPAEIDISIRK
eukprot:gnl/TRDRNA2_/TRDRNA2_210880_c0_seq1.p1 gnl/TRDRNA2_/TRDRNA2_210880_c0~~gnl/TRDRNA2_/TRDRNA2_210880_c0_seq1.p1  ORF type:complete len:145 (+),score=16.90 gnl/TRDRNA2_/TRDRNA2_210880_c0_seq1:37-471(+)